MRNRQAPSIRSCTAGALLFVAVAISAPLSSPARAQASGMAGIGSTETITARATVQAVDPATRRVTVVGAEGNTVSMTAGPQVINFDQIKPGDTVLVRYDRSTQYVLSPPGAKLPKSRLTGAAVGAAKGQMPAGAIGSRLIVSGLVAGIDASNHTLRVVNPSGGEVRTIPVVSKQGLQNFDMIKVGDTITAVSSQAVAVSVERAK